MLELFVVAGGGGGGGLGEGGGIGCRTKPFRYRGRFSTHYIILDNYIISP